MNRNRVAFSSVIASLVAVLAGCSSNSSVDLGQGQGADPGTVDFPIAYVKHYFDAQTLEDFDDLNNPGRTRLAVPDADLFLRTSSSPSGTEISITGALTTTGNWDIKDVNVAPDGTRLIFSMRGPIDANDDERDPPFWTMWEFDTTTPVSASNPHAVIDTTLFPESSHDVSPHYLPDGSIVFSSTRQRGSKAVLRDEGKPGYEMQFQGAGESAFLLHVLSPDRQNIEQISFNLGHDLWPDTLRDAVPLPANPQSASFIPRQGRIVFSRWDSSGGGMSLYTMNADGTGLQLLYGARSHRLIVSGNDIYQQDFQFTRPREMEDGRILVMARPFGQDTDLGGDLLIVNTQDYVENAQPLAASASLSDPAQGRVTPNQVTLVDGPSRGGRFRSAYPLWDGSGRILVSWSLCRLQDSTAATPVPVPCTDARLANPNFESAPPLYSGFIYTPGNNTFRPLFVPMEGVMLSDLVALQARAPLWIKSTDIINPLLADQGVGLLSIRSIYDFDGSTAQTGGAQSGTCPNAGRTIAMLADPMLCTAAERPARFIRIEEAVPRFDRELDMSLPDIDFGAAVGSGVGFMRVILGYAPIEPDGSVSIRVPANLPFTMSVLDANGRRLPQFGRHTSWLQLRPGEERHCNGCHQAPGGNAVEKSHGRDGTSISAWLGTSSAMPFPNTLLATNGTPQTGDTMALARARASCSGGPSGCSEMPRVNLLYQDVWTTPAPMPAVTLSLSYAGGGYATGGTGEGLATTAPTSSGCQLQWNGNCRIVINYEQHIQPLWMTPRQDLDMGGAVVADHTCTNCHAPVSDLGNAQVPAGDLDLSDGDRDAVTQHKNAYTELVTGGNQQQLDVNGQLVFVTIQVDTGQVDDMGNPIFITQQVPEGRRVVPLSARGSNQFFCNNGNGNPCVERFGPLGSHAGYLTPGELRLLSEWVDIGAQYFNNQFDPAVPLDN